MRTINLEVGQVFTCPCCRAEVVVTPTAVRSHLVAQVYELQWRMVCPNCGWRLATYNPKKVEVKQ